MLQYLALFKAIHVLGVVGWFAGLFYLVRIFVYHVEAMDKSEPERSVLINQYNIMEWRVYKIICNQGMMLTWIMGLLMLYAYGTEWIKLSFWIHIKLFLVILLTAYHLYCKKIIVRLEQGERPFTAFQFRLFNEVPSVFLLLILLLAFYKNSINLVNTFIGIVGFVIFLYVVARIYRKIRGA